MLTALKTCHLTMGQPSYCCTLSIFYSAEFQSAHYSSCWLHGQHPTCITVLYLMAVSALLASTPQCALVIHHCALFT